MAKILGIDPFTYEKERDSFLTGLKQFHSSRGTSFARQPSIGGKEVDLYLLFNRVAALGGYDKVNQPGLWDDLVEYFGIPKYCTHGGQAIKQFYQRYLYLYEKVSKGEDPDQRDEAEEPSAKRAKLKQILTNVPTKYDYQQHIVADTVRRTLGLSTDFVKKEPYDKLEKALISGLPNEVDFAINVCTLLSNEGKHSLNVPKNPRLIETLMAHVGIFRDGPGSLVTLHHEGWRPCTKRNFERFWMDSVSDKAVRDLLSPRSLFENEKGEKLPKSNVLGETSEYEELRNKVLHMGRDLGVHDVEGQRILQVAMIIRNLSFEEENMGFLASNLLVFRFLMLCIHSTYWTLRQLGLDTLGNLALKMELDPLAYPTTQLVLGLVTKCISSSDRYDVVQGLEILARLCQVVNNWDLISENLQQSVYDDIVNLLTVHDIQLIVFTLEALYHLTELGETPANHVARIKAAIDTLVQMVTIEAQAYGPNSLLGIKVVEHVPAGSLAQQQPGHVHAQLAQRAAAPKPLHQHNRAPGTPQRPVGIQTPLRANIPTAQGLRPGVGQTPPNRPGIVPMPPMRYGTPGSPHRPGMVNTPPQRPGMPPYQRPGLPAQQQIMGQQGMLRPQLPANYMQRTPGNRQRNQSPTVNQAECDAIAVAWLKAYYECVPGSVSIKNEVYAEYLATCSRYAIKNALNSTGFSDCIKMAFPQIHHQRVERDDGTLEMQLLGIMRRPTPHAFPPPPKRVVTGYVSAPGVRPMVYAGTPQTNAQIPPTHRPVIATRQPLVSNNLAPIRPQNGNPGTVVINAQGLPPVQNVQQLVATPPQTPPLSTTQTVTQINQPASQNQTHQEVLTPNSTQDEAMETDQSADDVNSKQENSAIASNTYEACLPVNRPPSRRRSCSGSSAHGSPPRSPKRPTRTKSPKSPKSPRSKSPKSPRPLSPKGTQSRLSPRVDVDINSDMSHAQMERIGDDARVPIKETAIEKVENPCLRGLTDQPSTRRMSAESRTSQNGNVKLNGGSNVNKICTSVDMVSPRTTDESHTRTDAVHMNGDVLSPAPSDSSTATSDPMSPKRNGANPTTSPSILDKKAKIAQLLQDTKAAKEALGLGQNGIVAHLGNGDCTESGTVDQAVEDDLPTAEGLTKQMAEATALMPETNGCDDNLLSESTDGINDHLIDDEDYSLAYSTDGTNDDPQGDPESSSTSTVTTVTTSQHTVNSTVTTTTVQTSQHQGTGSQTPTAITLEQTAGQRSAQHIVTGDQINTQVVNTDSCNTSAQSSLGTGTTVGNQTGQSMSGSSFQTDKPGSAAIAELLQRKLLNTSQQQAVGDNTQLGSQVQMVRPSVPSPQHQQSHLMQQLQQRLQRPNPNTQQQVNQAACPTSQQPLVGMESSQIGSNEYNLGQQTPVLLGGSNVTTTHAAVQQQLLQRLKAPQLVQSQGQQQGLVQQRLQTPIGVNVSQVQQQLDPPSRPSSTGPPSRPPSRPPSAGPQVRPPSTGPAPLPSPSGSSDAGTLPPASPTPAGTQPARRPSTTSTTSTDSKAAANAKGKKRKGRSNSIESRRSSNTSVSGEIQYMCQWNDCNIYFDTAKAVSGHVAKEHVTQLPLHGLCPWETCDGVRRGKWSLMTHVQDRHLTEAALKAAAIRRQQQPQQPQPAAPAATTPAKTPSKPSGPAPVYPQDAALQAIRRFTPRPPYPELGEMKEGPVTKHIRLTSALILRNIARYSSCGRSLLKRHESHLACMALSAVEASTALSHVLAELEHHALTSPAAKPESDGEGGQSSGEDSDTEDEADRTETIDTTDLDVSMTSQEGVVH